MKKITKGNKRIIAVGSIGVIILIGIFFVIYPGALPCPYSQPPSRPYIYNITPDPDGNVYIHWDPCLRVERYRVFIYNPSGNLDSATYVGIVTSYTKNGLSNGVWGFEVVAENCAGTSGHSSRESVTVAIPSVPSAPILYTISPSTDTDGIIYLSWSTVSDATSYKVYRAKEGGLYGNIATIFGTSYTDSGIGKVGQSIKYNYKIRAFNQYGGSVYSNIKSVTVELPSIPPPPPDPIPNTPKLEAITPIIDTDGIIDLEWSIEEYATSYKLSYFVCGSGTFTTIRYILNNYYSIMLENGEYGFRVQAVNYAGSSDVSNYEYVTVAIIVNQIPTATIISISPNPATQEVDTVSFSGSGIDTDGTIIEYKWSSSKDGDLSVLNSFSMSANNLSIGEHTIYFKVKDNNEVWSDTDSLTLTIEEALDGNGNGVDVPLAPTLEPITPTIDTDGDITLIWSIVSNVTSYNVYFSENGISFERIIDGLSGTTYRHLGLTNGTYYYKVTAVNINGESDYSNMEDVTVEISEEPPPPPPDDLTGIIIMLVAVIIGGIGVIYLTRRLKRKLVK